MKNPIPDYGDWFTGFGGMTLGAISAGLDVVFGAEYDPKIANVYRQNIGDHIRVCDLLKVDAADFPRVDVFHASPPCPNFSQAKTNGVETENDIALSAKVAEYITYHLPDVFTLENVYQYRNSQSWQTIASALLYNGYLFNYWHVNMADYGVPQTRQRMIVIARRDGVMPQLPPATHTEDPQPGLFGTMARWVSWYEVIEDLMDMRLPHKPTDRLLVHISECGKSVDGLVAVDGQNTSFDTGRLTVREANEPMFTVNANRSPTEYLIKNGSYYASPIDFVLRWQTFPDGYSGAGFYGIGNAVPPLFAEKLYQHLFPSLRKEPQP